MKSPPCNKNCENLSPFPCVNKRNEICRSESTGTFPAQGCFGEEFARKPLIVPGLTRRGGRSTLNLERIRKDYGRITSDNADPRGGSIDTQLGKDPQRLWKDRLWQCWSWGGSIDAQLGKDPQRLWEDHLWQCWSWEGVDWHSTWKGSAKTLEGSPLTMLILGGWGVDRHSTWKGSVKTMEGLPQLGKDLQRPWKDHLNLERICNDFGRILLTPSPPGSALSVVILPRLSVNQTPPQGSAFAEEILSKSLRILCKFRQSFQGHCGSFPSWGDRSKVIVDPFQVEAILPRSLWILSNLSVDQPPPHRISIVRGDPSIVFADPF